MLNNSRYWNLEGKTLAVGTLYCIGRNYSAHAEEMGASPNAEPVVFIKPPTAYCPSGSTITLPSWSMNIHHEVELVLVIGSDVMPHTVHDAWSCIAGVGVGIDLTARDVQSAAKGSGEPWARSKGWFRSAPVSKIVPLSKSGKGPWTIQLNVNSELRQKISTASMIFPVERIITELANVFGLRAGDAIFTGTPSGVGQVLAGDVAEALLDDTILLEVSFA